MVSILAASLNNYKNEIILKFSKRSEENHTGNPEWEPAYSSQDSNYGPWK
jgi:hypothetical protein